MKDNKHMVYTHTRNDTNEVFYVGCTQDKNRPYRKGSNDRNSTWNDIVSQTDYTVDIPYKNLSERDAYELESRMILTIGRMDLGTGTLCNKQSKWIKSNFKAKVLRVTSLPPNER